MKPLLELNDVRVHYRAPGGLLFPRRADVVKAVDGVSLQANPGEVVGLVGESGCGKSTLARAIFRLAPLTSGDILFDGVNLARMRGRELRRARTRLQMVFQDPYASLNPRMTVFDALAEPMHVHGLAPRGELAARVSGLMERVGLSARYMKKYPHEFSGGQRQRIAIARALALNPAMLVADEPVSALDVSVQAQILNLLHGLVQDQGLGMILISHDLSVVRHLCRRVFVMYYGKIVEEGPTEELFTNPQHSYTKTLLDSVPIPDPERERARLKERIWKAGNQEGKHF